MTLDPGVFWTAVVAVALTLVPFRKVEYTGPEVG